jgi:hypothetical protein
MKWAALVPENERPEILNQKHKDWFILFRWIPRSWSSWLGNPPRKIWGNAASVLPILDPVTGLRIGSYPQPIPEPGQWWIGLPLYFTWHLKSGWHVRAGFRWDDRDNYYALSFTIKKFK